MVLILFALTRETELSIYVHVLSYWTVRFHVVLTLFRNYFDFAHTTIIIANVYHTSDRIFFRYIQFYRRKNSIHFLCIHFSTPPHWLYGFDVGAMAQRLTVSENECFCSLHDSYETRDM